MVQKGTRFLGYYKNGKASGTFWVGMMGGSPYALLHGKIRKSDSTISGNEISYIYPDMKTAFLGKFEEQVMIDTKHCDVLLLKCNALNIPEIVQFSKKDEILPSFYYEPPSNISFGAGPVGIRDPYEEAMVELRMSNIPGSGDGVFIKKNATKGMVVSLYNGFVFDKEQQQIYQHNCAYNITKKDDERRHCLKYAIGLGYGNVVLNIPPEMDNNASFLPTIGPKVTPKWIRIWYSSKIYILIELFLIHQTNTDYTFLG